MCSYFPISKSDKTTPSLQSEYRRILSALALDFKAQPEESWESSPAQNQNPKDALAIQLNGAPAHLQDRLKEEFLGTGPLKELLMDPEVTEILIMGDGPLLFERDGKLLNHDQNFLGEKTFQRFAHQLLEEAGISLTLKAPYGDGTWRSFRVHAVQPPVTKKVCISLRRQSLKAWSLSDLLERNWCSERWAERLADWIHKGKSLIIFGDTGSGKTATAEALLGELPGTCRALILEDTPELRPPNDFSLTLHTRRAVEDLREITFSDLLKQSLRMRPDRLIMGEIRGEEAKDYLLTLASGHAGGLATLHAPSAQQALIRLEMLVQLGAPQWDLRSVRVLISQSIHYLIQVGRSASGERRLLGVSKVDGLEEHGLLLETFDLNEKP